MNGKQIILGVVLFLVVIGLWIMSQFNSFLALDEKSTYLYSQVENMYDRRVDLVPQVTAVVKRYAVFEKSTLETVTALRSESSKFDQLQKMITDGTYKSPEFSSLLGSTLSSLKVTVEAYPQLKADTQFTNLFTTLEGSENRIRVAIMDYNMYVSDYNVRLRSFPTGLLLQYFFGFKPRERVMPPEGKDIKAVPSVDNMLDISK